jgi:hypothetical protein
MKLRNTLLLGIAAAALTVGAHAQQILTYSSAAGPGFNTQYNDGDLVLAFFSASDASSGSPPNSNGDVLFNIGAASSYTGLAPGVYSVAGFNGSATSGQPALGSGSSEITTNLTVPSANTFWTVMGSNTTSQQLWLTGATAQVQQSTGTQTTIANHISSIGSAGAGAPNADGSAYDSAQTTENYLVPAAGRWSGTSVVADAVVSASNNTLGLYSLLPNPSGSSTYLGFFTLTDTSGAFSLTFTAIPEPSTYAAILGALTVAFVLVRRRFGAASLLA